MNTRTPKARRLVVPRRRRLAALAASALVGAAGLVSVQSTQVAAAPIAVTGATFEWGINAEVQGPSPFGGCAYLSAGTSDGTEATYRASEGNVEIRRNGAVPTWADKCTMTAGSVNQKVVWSNGTGTVDPATGVVDLTFTGNFSVTFYGGLVPFTFQGLRVRVNADGTGTVTAPSMVGYSSSQDDPNNKTPLSPSTNVRVADLSGVNAATSTGFTTTPRYVGVTYDATGDHAPQNRTMTGWGAWPAGFVEFHMRTGLSSFWYSSGGAFDAKKPPSALTVSYGQLPVDPETPTPTTPTTPSDPTDPVDPADPVDPTPTVPGSPSDPDDPAGPGDPTAPAVPGQPAPSTAPDGGARAATPVRAAPRYAG